MKKQTLFPLTVFAASVMLMAGCMHQPPLKQLTLNLPSQTLAYHTDKYQTVTMNGGDNSPATNHMTDAGATLGRVLFYDPKLSVNNAIACASCHKQQYGFGDNQPFSTGFQGQLTIRNTPALINEANKSVFFWDGRVNSLETQTLMPVQNHIEMGLENFKALPGKLASISYYPELFQNAFGTSTITNDEIQMALAQFVRSIASDFSNSSGMSADAIAGQQLFVQKYKCADCHVGNNEGGAPISVMGGGYMPATPQQTAVPNSSNIGLDVQYADQGIQGLTGNAAQNGYFIIPSLRNVALTAPYMHDGRFATLSDVIDHYSTGILPHPFLDPLLLDSNFVSGQIIVQKGAPVKMNISATEKRQLIAFLTALTDNTITTDVRFSNPFK